MITKEKFNYSLKIMKDRIYRVLDLEKKYSLNKK